MLHDRVALVTGAATGIGEATARLFAEHGAQVFLLDFDAARNEAVAASIRAQSGRAEPFTVDVTDGPALAAFAAGGGGAGDRRDFASVDLGQRCIRHEDGQPAFVVF